MNNHMAGYLAAGCVGLALGVGVTFVSLARGEAAQPSSPEASTTQGQVGTTADALQTVLFETTLTDVLGRVAMIREFERAPGTGGTPHRHPGSHTFGYVLEGTYEVQVDDGPLQRLGPGETFYEYPGALHAVSRNGSTTDAVRYLVLTISDPTLPATVQEQSAPPSR
jgi:quercetin dioxygenase-like cupin family protein